MPQSIPKGLTPESILKALDEFDADVEHPFGPPTVDVERMRLIDFGRVELAAKVEWVAVTCGDGSGFDVLSFDEDDDSEWYIEVKTTGLGKHFPFYVTATEVRCSEDGPTRFRLYRVFDFARNPQVYVVAGAPSRECRLEPVEYRPSL